LKVSRPTTLPLLPCPLRLLSLSPSVIHLGIVFSLYDNVLLLFLVSRSDFPLSRVCFFPQFFFIPLLRTSFPFRVSAFTFNFLSGRPLYHPAAMPVFQGFFLFTLFKISSTFPKRSYYPFFLPIIYPSPPLRLALVKEPVFWIPYTSNIFLRLLPYDPPPVLYLGFDQNVQLPPFDAHEGFWTNVSFSTFLYPSQGRPR